MRRHLLICLGILAAGFAFSGCGKKEEAPSATTSAAAGSGGTAAPAGSWTPEALEELLAPVALYPDVVLGHVLAASTNPQEVLDAGNWLIDHQDLSGKQVDDEAAKLGLSPSVRALLQFPEALDMMCMQMDWTTELGQAFTADQGAVLDAVQRLRAQAKDVGNLQSSPQLKVETESQDGKEVITVDPPSPDVVYVPKYDPQAVYAPPPATIPPPSTINVASAPGTATTVTTSGTTTTVATAPTTTTTTTEEKGHSTGALVTTGLLAFGAGILVNEVFDDDDDWDHYGPNYYGGGMYYGGAPYYPPPPYMYRPPYGNGYYPSHGYNRPANYQRGFNNNTIIVNNGGNDYWKRNGRGQNGISTRPAQSPITSAKPRRSDLDQLNRQTADRGRQSLEVASRDVATRDRPAQGGYAGARPENKAARDRMVAKAPPPGVAQDLPKRPTQSYGGTKGSGYKGAQNREYKGAQNRPAGAAGGRPGANQASPATREAPSSRAAADRGRDRSTGAPTGAARPQAATRPAAAPAQRPAPQPREAAPDRADRTAFGGGGGAQSSGRAERQASERGRSSMGGGGGNKARKPRR
jgi:uncharacterized protein DUF3300